MTRFQASGPRIGYRPIPREKIDQKILGLYGMWASLAPEDREKIANWFRRKGRVEEVDGLDSYVDTSLTRQDVPDIDEVDTAEVLVGNTNPSTQPVWLQRIQQGTRESYEDEGPSFRNLVPGERPRAYIEDPQKELDMYREEYLRNLASAKENW